MKISKLKQARLDAGKGIEEISLAINIRKQYLIALEEENFDIIPGKVYVDGYLKLYAKYLGIITPIIEEKIAMQCFQSTVIPIKERFKKYIMIFSFLMLILSVVAYRYMFYSSDYNQLPKIKSTYFIDADVVYDDK
jgi:hypothetical protein